MFNQLDNIVLSDHGGSGYGRDIKLLTRFSIKVRKCFSNTDNKERQLCVLDFCPSQVKTCSNDCNGH